MTTWWNKNVPNRIEDFQSWVGDINKISKVYCRQYISQCGYQNLIDCGCGNATQYYGFKEDNYQIDYTGLDSCTYFLQTNREKNINMIEGELEEILPIEDNFYDCVYCHEVMEHLSYYEQALNEFIRIGKKEVLIGWFIKPDQIEEINYWIEEDLFHNKYQIDKLESFILNNKKVDRIFWTTLNDKEHVLHILLK